MKHICAHACSSLSWSSPPSLFATQPPCECGVGPRLHTIALWWGNVHEKRLEFNNPCHAAFTRVHGAHSQFQMMPMFSQSNSRECGVAQPTPAGFEVQDRMQGVWTISKDEPWSNPTPDLWIYVYIVVYTYTISTATPHSPNNNMEIIVVSQPDWLQPTCPMEHTHTSREATA